MKELNLVEKMMTKNLNDEELLNLLEKCDIDIYQREDNRVWMNNCYHPQDAEYYLFGEYHSFDIQELDEYQEKEEIFNNLKLYQYEKNEKQILDLLKNIIKDETYMYKVKHFSDGLENFIKSGSEHGVYVLV